VINLVSAARGYLVMLAVMLAVSVQ